MTATAALLILLVLTSNLRGPSAAAVRHTGAAENYPDTVKYTDISTEDGQEHKIMPKFDDTTTRLPAAADGGIRSYRCEISARKRDNASLIILTSFDANNQQELAKQINRAASLSSPDQSSASDDSAEFKISYQLVDGKKPGECSSTNSGSIHENMFLVMQLSNKGHRSVTYEQSDTRRVGIGNRMKLIDLKVILVEQNFCARTLTSFGGNCYTNSASALKEGTLIEQLTSIGADGNLLRLASFKSMQEIKQFVEASQQEAVKSSHSVPRRKVPLNLSQRVRIGLFYNAENSSGRSLMFLDVQGANCSLKSVEDPELLNYIRPPVNNSHQRACGSLRVTRETGKISIEFNDCGEKLRALISFDEVPNKQRERCSVNCTRPVLEWLLNSSSAVDVDDNARVGQSPREKAEGSLRIDLMACTFVALMMLILLAIMCLLVWNIRQRSSETSATPAVHSRASATQESTSLTETGGSYDVDLLEDHTTCGTRSSTLEI